MGGKNGTVLTTWWCFFGGFSLALISTKSEMSSQDHILHPIRPRQPEMKRSNRVHSGFERGKGTGDWRLGPCWIGKLVQAFFMQLQKVLCVGAWRMKKTAVSLKPSPNWITARRMSGPKLWSMIIYFVHVDIWYCELDMMRLDQHVFFETIQSNERSQISQIWRVSCSLFVVTLQFGPENFRWRTPWVQSRQWSDSLII